MNQIDRYEIVNQIIRDNGGPVNFEYYRGYCDYTRDLAAVVSGPAEIHDGLTGEMSVMPAWAHGCEFNSLYNLYFYNLNPITE